MTATTPSASTLRGAPARFPGGLVEVGPDIHAWLVPNGDWSESNAGLILSGKQATLVDTAWDLALTRRLLAAVARQTDLPITRLILTHGDGDHVNGAQLLPAAELIASEPTAADMAEESPAELRRSTFGARLLATTGIGAPRRFGRYLTDMFAPFDFRGIRLPTPATTFSEALHISQDGRDLALVRLGPAHTAGDTIVHIPDASVVFAGDLLFCGVTPNSWSGSASSWRRALDAIDQLEPAVIVPGHGPVSDRSGLAELDAYWSWLDQHARAHLAAGRSVDETARLITTSDEFAAAPWGTWLCPERTVLNVVTIDRERRGVQTTIAHSERPRMMWKVAALAHHLHTHNT
jgi:cyclase